MRIDLRYRLISLVVAFLAAVGTAAEIDAGVWYGSSVGDERWVVGQDNHYYPYGMLMGESSNILASARGYKGVSFNPYRFGSKEYLTTASANLLDFTARTYDPTTLLFQTQDPKATIFTPFNSYTYCAGDPVNRVDKEGEVWDILWDVCNVVYDVGCAVKAHIEGDHEKAKGYWIDAAADTGAALLPFIPAGTTKAVKVTIKGADKAVDAAKAVDHATDANKGLKNTDRIAEGKAFEKSEFQASVDNGLDVVSQKTLVPLNGKGNVKGNRTKPDQLVRNSDGTYYIIETKLTETTPLTKGQRVAKNHIKQGDGWFEVRSKIDEFGLKPGETIRVVDFIRKNKYP